MSDSPKPRVKLLPLAIAIWIGWSLGGLTAVYTANAAADSLGYAGLVLGAVVGAALGITIGTKIYQRLRDS